MPESDARPLAAKKGEVPVGSRSGIGSGSGLGRSVGLGPRSCLSLASAADPPDRRQVKDISSLVKDYAEFHVSS